MSGAVRTRFHRAGYRILHPAGTAPIVEDDGLALAESDAIIDYIAARHGGGRLVLAPIMPISRAISTGIISPQGR